jgi:hypothetical protein
MQKSHEPCIHEVEICGELKKRGTISLIHLEQECHELFSAQYTR